MTDLPRRRLLWLTERYPPHKGGMAVSCDRLVAGLRRRDHEVDVVALTGDPAARGMERVERDRGVDFRLAAEVSPGNAAQLGFSAARSRHRARAYTHVVGFGCGLSGFMAVTYAAWLKLPSLILVRGNDFDRDWFSPRRGLWVREALSRADVIGVVSPEKGDKIKALFPAADVRWTPNSVDVKQWELLPADRAVRDEVRAELGAGGRRVVGIFGEMKYKKRIPLWLAGLRDAGLRERVGLLLVGRLDEETTQILADPALAPSKQRLMDFRAQDQLPGLYAACDFVAVPSLFEGMPNVLLEAMAAGAVPIASDAGAMPAVVDDGRTGFIFAAEDRAAAAAVTARALALTDSELAAMAKAAREHVAANFSPARELDTLEGIIF